MAMSARMTGGRVAIATAVSTAARASGRARGRSSAMSVIVAGVYGLARRLASGASLALWAHQRVGKVRA